MIAVKGSDPYALPPCQTCGGSRIDPDCWDHIDESDGSLAAEWDDYDWREIAPCSGCADRPVSGDVVWVVEAGDEREPIKPPIRISTTEMLCPYCNNRLVEVDNPMRREIRHVRGVHCDGAPFGIVVAGYATVEALPIVDWDFDGAWPDKGDVIVLDGEVGAAWISHDPEDYTNTTNIDLPDAVPGGTAYILTALVIQSDSPNQTDTVWDRGDGTFWLVEDDSDGREPPSGHPLPAIGSPVSVDWITDRYGVTP